MYLGRQAIFDRDANVVAYELLYRGSPTSSVSAIDDPTMATLTVLTNALVELGIPAVAEHRDIFVNFPGEVLDHIVTEIIPKDRCVIEILETVQPDRETLDAITKLKEDGFRLALDDVVYEDRLIPLIELADLIKIDLRLTDPSDLPGHVEKLRQYPVTLLAEKVETHEEKETCLDLGFDLFQGYFYCKPDLLKCPDVDIEKSRTLYLLTRLHDDEVSIQEASLLIRQDPTMCFKLLRFLNSTIAGLHNEIESIEHAVALIGLRRIKAWATLLGLGNISSKPHELLATANLRGHLCEEIGRKIFHDNSPSFYMVGMFSLLDAFTDTSLEEVLDSLPLSQDLVDGILSRTGPLGEALNAAIAWERYDLESLDVPVTDLFRCYRSAVRQSGMADELATK